MAIGNIRSINANHLHVYNKINSISLLSRFIIIYAFITEQQNIIYSGVGKRVFLLVPTRPGAGQIKEQRSQTDSKQRQFTKTRFHTVNQVQPTVRSAEPARPRLLLGNQHSGTKRCHQTAESQDGPKLDNFRAVIIY